MFKFFIFALFVLQTLATTRNYNLQYTQGGANNEYWAFSAGSDTSGQNPTLNVNSGDTLNFVINFINGQDQPFDVHTKPFSAGATSNRYENKAPLNITQNGGTFTIVIGSDAPSVLYYFSENSGSGGLILVAANCSGFPIANTNNSGTCTADPQQNGFTCTAFCATNYTATISPLQATCNNGTYSTTGRCNSDFAPTPVPEPTPEPTPTPSPETVVFPTGNNIVTYIFTVDGSSQNENCNHIKDTTVVALNNYGTSIVKTEGAVFFANVSDCNDDNGGSSFTIDVYVVGRDADVVVVDEDSFSTLLTNEIERLDSNVQVNDVSYERSSGLFMRASLLALMASVLVAMA